MGTSLVRTGRLSAFFITDQMQAIDAIAVAGQSCDLFGTLRLTFAALRGAYGLCRCGIRGSRGGAMAGAGRTGGRHPLFLPVSYFDCI